MKKFLLTCFALVFAVSVWAQERTITGKVASAEDGTPLPGVNVVVKGTTNGTVTDAEGNFSLSIPNSGASLVFSFIGLQTQEVLVGERSVVDVTLSLDVQQLSEVVVTAIGIEREKKGLGYSVATVKSDNIAQRSEPDPLRALQGKMAGVNITGGGGAPGQSTKINIRGQGSLTGTTQPLFVVDGVPFDNSVNASTGANLGTQYSNRAFDIDPNNIESVTVLKGAAAAALYGSRGSNGVLIITTKAGKKQIKKGLEVTYNHSSSWEKISGIPDYQNVYGQGSNQNYSGAFIGNWGAPFAEYVDELNSKYGTSYSKTIVPGYPEGTVPHPLAANAYPLAQGSATAFPEFFTDMDGDGQSDDPIPVPYTNYDIIGGFFKTGKVQENSVTVSGGSEKATLNATISRMDNTGMIPNSDASRTSIAMGGIANLDNGLIVSGTVNYVNTTQQGPQSGASIYNDYSGGAGSSIYGRLFYLPRNYNLNGYPFENPLTGDNMFYRVGPDNPYWVAKYNTYTSDVNRAFGHLTLSYDITSWYNVTLKGGFNTYSDSRRNVVKKGSTSDVNGEIWTNDLTNTELDYNFMNTFTKDFSEAFSVRAIIGLNTNQRKFSSRMIVGDNIIAKGFNHLDGTSTQIVSAGNDYERLQRFYAVYGDVLLTFKDMIYLTLTGRNDWSSTLPTQNQSYFYPSASLAFAFTEVLNTENSFLNFGKIRLAYSQAGNEAYSPFLTTTPFFLTSPFTTSGGTVMNRAYLTDRLGNADLVNELTSEVEAGLELQLFNNRIGLDLTYFQRSATEQIVAARTPASTGFNEAIVNAGEVENKGWEIAINATPVSLDNGFKWDINLNYTRLRSLVVDAGPAGDIFYGGVGGGWSGVLGNVHRSGYPYGQIFGTRNAKADDGTLLINKATGMPFAEPIGTIIGDPNPDFTLGFMNTFSWKGFTLTALIDWKQGGDIFSVTAASLFLRGQLAVTADREELRIVPGYYGDPSTYKLITDDGGNPIKVKNTTPVSAFDYHFGDGFGAYGQDEVNVYDGTVIRLREVSLGYAIPKTVLKKTPFGSARITLTGRNLWFKAPNLLEGLNLDPEVLAETSDRSSQGFEAGSAPTTRRYGVNLTLTF
jgi:TonB-linked SusC/RagA family outer membrane protein